MSSYTSKLQRHASSSHVKRTAQSVIDKFVSGPQKRGGVATNIGKSPPSFCQIHIVTFSTWKVF